MTTKEMILDYLTNVGPLTVASCMTEIGTVDLRARVSDLRKDGHFILTRPITKTNRWGKKVTFNEYSMGVSA